MTQEEFFKKYVQVVLALKAPKNQKNTFGGFNYRSCEDIQEGIKKTLKDLKIEDCISVCTDEVQVIGGRYYVVATAKFTDGEHEVVAHGYAREPEARSKMDEAQVTGSSSSYARKYALNGLYSIDDTKIEATPEIDAQDNSKKTTSSNRNFDYKMAISACKSTDELVSLWNSHPELQKDVNFTACLGEKKKELTK